MRRTAQEKAAVVAYRASGLSHQEIAKRTGIPRRTVTDILDNPSVVEVVEAATIEQVTAAMWQTVSQASDGTKEAITRLRSIIADSRSRPADVVRASEALARLLSVVAPQYALLTGQATERTENLNLNIEEERPYPLAPEAIRSQVVGWMAMIENSTDDELLEREQMVMRLIEVAKNVARVDPR